MKFFRPLPLVNTCATVAAAAAKQTLLHQPTGPYCVATTQHVINHTTPNDITAPVGSNNTGTHLLLTAYLPTTQAPNASSSAAPYTDAVNAALWSAALGLPPSALSTLAAPLQHRHASIDSLPVISNASHAPLLFLPGAGMPVWAYTALLSELASHGHAVHAVEHVGEAPYTPLPGSSGGVRGAFPAPLNAWTIAQVQEIYAHRLRDVAAVFGDPQSVPWLPSSSSSSSSSGAPDTCSSESNNAFSPPARWGVLGHSVGGAAAAGLMASDPRSSSASPDDLSRLFAAGANLDGWYFFSIWDNFGNGTSTPTSHSAYPDLAPRPFLQLAKTVPTPDADATWRNFSAAQSGWLRDASVRGAAHFDFSDLPLWVELLGRDGGSANAPLDDGVLGGISGRRVTEVVAQILVEYFGHVGRNGEGALEGVDRLIEGTPEVTGREAKGGGGGGGGVCPID